MSCRTRLVAVASLGIAVSLSGCAAIRLESVVRPDPTAPEGWVALDADAAAAEVQVSRGGRPLVASASMPLQAGDEIQAGHQSAVVLTFTEYGTVVLAPETRVRIGSLEVLFGRIFASVRGLFSAESDGVVAGVAGTEFMMELGADRTVRVVVVEGAVGVRSKAGSWPPVRMAASEASRSSYPHLAPPDVEPADPSEIGALRDWARRVRTAPPAGYCCDGGRVFSSSASACRGVFRGTAEEARAACTSGWCCASGQAFATSQDRCRSAGGAFFPDQAAAQRACAPPPETRAPPPETRAPLQEMGWCCYLPSGEGQGQVRWESRSRCGGKFFSDERTARSQCYVIR